MANSEEQAVNPQAERMVDFYGDNIPVAQDATGEVYVPLRPLAVFLGLDQAAQYRRVQRDEVMARRIKRVMMHDPNGRLREQLCLPLDLLPGWLFGITTARVSSDLKVKLNRYREECFRVLWNAFRGDVLPYTPAPTATSLTFAEQTLEMIRAMEHLAQQQVEIERRTSGIENRQGVLEGYMRGFIHDTRQRLSEAEAQLQQTSGRLDVTDTRLTTIELRLDPAAQITDEQAAEIALGVKNVAYAMGGNSPSYGKVYSELYRRYRISSYKNLPQAKYDEVISWLSRWFDEVAGDDKDEDKAQE